MGMSCDILAVPLVSGGSSAPVSGFCALSGRSRRPLVFPPLGRMGETTIYPPAPTIPASAEENPAESGVSARFRRETSRGVPRDLGFASGKFPGALPGCTSDAAGVSYFEIPGNPPRERQAVGCLPSYREKALWRRPFPLNFPAMGPEIPPPIRHSGICGGRPVAAISRLGRHPVATGFRRDLG